MRICIYSPYIPEHTGGGEKYLFDVARILATRHQVQVAIPTTKFPRQSAHIPEFLTSMRRKYETFLNESLERVEFVATPLGTSASFWQKLKWTVQFDVMYYATDGSLFFSLAKRNILHIQVPLQLAKNSPLERLKLFNWSVKNTNSEFTKQVIERSWQTRINFVHHPMVDLSFPKRVKKEKIILSVGRFFRQLHSKRQDILVEMFKELRTRHPQVSKGWKLVLIGAVEDAEYANQISTLSQGLPIEVLHQVSRFQLLEWYAKASIYWHAAGFGVDETETPEKVEHFGISTVEAMAMGEAPVVLGKGGQKEILGEELKEWSWQTTAEGADKTARLMEDTQLRQSVSELAQVRARLFDAQQFESTLWQMVEG